MTLKEFLGIINMQVRYRVTDRMTRESVKISAKDKETLKRKIYMVFQDKDGTLNICLYQMENLSC